MRLYTPKLFIALSEGYRFSDLRADATAGLTVAIVAFPLSMALAIASGLPPERGLFTAIIAGFLISMLGGVRQQIGGPAGAFVVVVFNIVAAHGYGGLVIATLMAGVMLIAAGFMKLGTYVKYVPYPVVTGFTAGIAVIIFTSQVGDILGLQLENPPAAFAERWALYAARVGDTQLATLGLALGTLALMLGLRRISPKIPFFLIGIVAATATAMLAGLPVETVETRFGAVPSMPPAPIIPALSWEVMVELLPSAATIAFLAGIESLLCAVVADGMTGRRHRSNTELVAQGFANIGSVIFGGMPATGTVARTATNIRAGARTPVAGMLHAAFVLIFMIALAPLAGAMPLAALGAVLVIVAWNMSEYHRFLALLRASWGERLITVTTFLLTVFADLTLAIEVGVVMAAFFFMHRMAEAVEITTQATLIESDVDDFAAPRPDALAREAVPPGVEVFQINGPFFFGAASRLTDILSQTAKPPRVFILRMGRVPLIDTTGGQALSNFVAEAARKGTRVILSNVKGQPLTMIESLGLASGPNGVVITKNLERALEAARGMMGGPPGAGN
ncbi:MAG TPA: SulP family inorganic anion transporter [Micropepsaceae bacterium]|nr:SulP family inorganic anion transporter [Micropepsaceae bacterium]